MIRLCAKCGHEQKVHDSVCGVCLVRVCGCDAFEPEMTDMDAQEMRAEMGREE